MNEPAGDDAVFTTWMAARPGSRARVEGRARELLAAALAELRSDWARTPDVVARLQRAERGLPGRLRRELTELIYLAVRFELRVQAVVAELSSRRRGLAIAFGASERERLALLVCELAAGVPPAPGLDELGGLLGFRPSLAQVAGPEAGLRGARGDARAALALGFPAWILERLRSALGDARALPILGELNQRAPLTLIANRVRAAPEEVVAALADAGVAARRAGLAPAGIVLEGHVNAYALPPYLDGRCDVMDEGSQLVAEVVDARPEHHVLDACAGAGGKTLALAIAMHGRGRILALDVAGKKLEEARARLRRLGFSNAIARQVDEHGPLPVEALPGQGGAPAAGWDRVLVDAPCTALGTLRRHPELRHLVTPEAVRAASHRQLGLLARYADLCAPGGRLVYATCTLLSEENQDVVERFLRERRDFRPLPLARIVGDARAAALGDGQTLQVAPDRQGTDGFFAAVLERRPDSTSSP